MPDPKIELVVLAVDALTVEVLLSPVVAEVVVPSSFDDRPKSPAFTLGVAIKMFQHCMTSEIVVQKEYRLYWRYLFQLASVANRKSQSEC